MKQMLVFLIVATIFSCKPEVEQNATTQTKGDAETDLRYALRGAWVNVEYISLLEKTLSPTAARDSMRATSFYELLIDTSTERDKLLIVASGIPGKEDKRYDLTVHLKPGLTPTSYPITVPGDTPDSSAARQLQEVSYEINGSDTTLFIKGYDEKKVLLSVQQFKKMSDGEDSPAEAAERIAVLAGSYRYTNDSGMMKTIVLYTNGRLSGLEPYNYYFIGTNPASGPTLYDHLYTSVNASDTTKDSILHWRYQRRGDSLVLYPKEKDVFNTTVISGQSQYVLIKNKL